MNGFCSFEPLFLPNWKISTCPCQRVSQAGKVKKRRKRKDRGNNGENTARFCAGRSTRSKNGKSCVAASHVLKAQNAPPCENYFHRATCWQQCRRGRVRPKTVTRFPKILLLIIRARSEISLFCFLELNGNDHSFSPVFRLFSLRKSRTRDSIEAS